MMEELAKAGVAQGLSERLAMKLSVVTARGASALACQEKEAAPKALREAVTSPGGTTEAGLNVFSNNHFSKTVHDVVQAATQRGLELSQK